MDNPTPIIGDAFGMDLSEFQRDKEGIEIIERDDGYIDALETGIYFSKFEAWPEHEKRLIKKAKGKMLDIGCGAGRHCLYLQNKGFDVTGIDASPGAVETCKKRGIKDVRLIPVQEIEKLSAERFDTVIMFGHNLALLGSVPDGKALLKKLAAITTPDALLLGTTLDALRTDNPLHLAYHELNRKRNRLPGQMRLRVRHELTASPWFNYLFTSKAELESILKGTGWVIAKWYGKIECGTVVIKS